VSIACIGFATNLSWLPAIQRVGLNKGALISLVLQQFELWPHAKHRWAPKRDTTIKILNQVLLSPKYGFGKTTGCFILILGSL
jgi:hypothetical protein